MKILNISVDKLTPYKLNSKKHPESQIEGISNSIKRFGFTQPVVVDQNNEIIIGHGRVEAAKKAGLKDVPCVVREDLSPSEIKALRLIDNRIAETGWDGELLGVDLGEIDFDFTPYNIAFDDLVEIPEIEGLTDPDAIPENVEPRTKLGDLYQLGNHRLLCGDSTKKEDVERLLGGQSPNTMVTDPPYGIKLDQSWRDKALGNKALGKGNSGLIQNDDKSDWTEVWQLFTGNIAYVWHASAFTDIVMNSLRNAGFDIKQQIIWNKSVMVMGRCDYHFKHEPCWYAVRKNKNHNWKGDRKQTTIWDAQPPNHIMGGSNEEKTTHPTQKPALLYEIAYNNHTNMGEYIYEPFGGSGTSIIVCEKMERRSLTMELDPKYCDVIIKRWEDFTGKKAEIVS